MYAAIAWSPFAGGPEMVLLEVPAEGGGLDKGAHRQDTWEADRSENTPWRAQLDLHSHYRQHCLEHAAQEPLPAPLQTGVLDSSPSMLSFWCPCHRQHCSAHAPLLSADMPLLAGYLKSHFFELCIRGEAGSLVSYRSYIHSVTGSVAHACSRLCGASHEAAWC